MCRQKMLEEIEKFKPNYLFNYLLRVIRRRKAQKEALRKLAAKHSSILMIIGGWTEEINLPILRRDHKDIDILVIESQWENLRDTLEEEGFEIETEPGKILARKGLVTIDIALVKEEKDHYIKGVYINESFLGQFRFPKDGFEKRGPFTVMSLELQWLSLGPERRTLRARMLARFLNPQRIKELDANFSFEVAK